MKMFGRVLVLRIVAAADVTACDAKPQVKPLVTRFQTLFTAVRGYRSNIDNFKQMRTAVHFEILLKLVRANSSGCHGLGLGYRNTRVDPVVNVRHHDFLINIIQKIMIVSLIKLQSFVC